MGGLPLIGSSWLDRWSSTPGPPLDQIQLLFSEGVFRFSDVNGENRKALPPWLCYDAVDTHEIRGIGLIKAPIHIVEFLWPSLGWHGLSLSVLIDTLSSR